MNIDPSSILPESEQPMQEHPCYAVVSPDGFFQPTTVRQFAHAAKKAYAGDEASWPVYERKGYRVVPVRLCQMQDIERAVTPPKKTDL